MPPSKRLWIAGWAGRYKVKLCIYHGFVGRGFCPRQPVLSAVKSGTKRHTRIGLEPG